MPMNVDFGTQYITSSLHHIVFFVVWRNVYKDTIKFLPCFQAYWVLDPELMPRFLPEAN